MTEQDDGRPAWQGWRGAHGPMLIAEIGGNHEGDFAYAERLVDLAVEAGADAVKFQIYYADDLVNAKESPDRHAHFRKFELSPEQHVSLARRCADAGVEYLASVWGTGPLPWIDEHLNFYKIGSGDLTAHSLLRSFAELGKPLILSSGLARVDEVVEAVEVIRAVDSRYDDPEQLAVLQCTSVYPLDKSDANITAMDTLAAATGAAVGYSDHTTDGQALRVAAARGARILEFHFTDNRDGKVFRDHFVSLTPDELRELTVDLDDLARLLGDGVKEPLQAEIDTDHVVSFRRAVYFGRDMDAGETVTEADLVLLRPAHGLPADRVHEVVGRRLTRAVGRLDRVDPSGLEA